MNRHPRHRDDDRARLDEGLRSFGSALVDAARDREQRRARRSPLTGRWRSPRLRGVVLASAIVLTAMVVLAVSGAVPPDRGSGRPVLGPEPAAAAAVAALRRTVRDGVLVRDATNDDRAWGRSRVQDWTDLVSRDQHVRITGGPAATEFWNPSAHERWSIEPAMFRAPDGRRVVSHVIEPGSANGSASESPIEEVDRLLADARRGRITVRSARAPGEQVLERRERCFADPGAAVMDCGGSRPGVRWPDRPPPGMRAVLLFERWWLSEGTRPRMLGADNGTLTPSGTGRTVLFRTRYRRWQALSRTSASLDLVRVPAFDPRRYLVIDGRASALGDAVRAGRLRCSNARGLCPR